MAEPQPHSADVSHLDIPALGIDDHGKPLASDMPLTDSAILAPDYRSLLTADALTETGFNRAALQLDAPPPVAALPDEQRAGFGWNELPLVLSRYDLGTIRRLEAFRRGSRRAPKAVMSTDRGVYLLKRREASDETRSRIITAHWVQRHLLDGGFPTPSLVPTRRSGSTLVHVGAHVYEIFDFVRGESFDRSEAAAGAAGRALGVMHRLLETFTRIADAPRGSFHQSPVVPRAFDRAHETFMKVLPPAAAGAGREYLRSLQRDMKTAADLADNCGASSGPERICHGDWHPGNMIYNNEHRIIGVVDYDSIRLQNPILDVANGALQFSAIGGADPSAWPDRLDTGRFKAFLRGYAGEMPVSEPKINAIPWLMAEAMIVEVLLPVAARGVFAGVRGDIMLEVIRRKVDWIMSNAKELNRATEDSV